MQLTVSNQTIEIHPIKVRQLGPVLSALSTVFRDGVWQGVVDVSDWMAFIASHQTVVLDGLAAATDQPREWLEELEPVDLCNLAFAVVEVNQDFFTRQVQPVMQRLNATLTRIGLPQISPLPSDGSSTPLEN